jgi:hypothetical protein
MESGRNSRVTNFLIGYGDSPVSSGVPGNTATGGFITDSRAPIRTTIGSVSSQLLINAETGYVEH